MVKDDPEFQCELNDIYEEIWFSEGKSNDQKIIEQNIIFILKREKLWQKGFSICFPCGALGEVDPEAGTYQYDYEIFSDMNTIIASGTCYGSGMKTCEGEKKDAFEIQDMTLEICEGYRKLKGTDKEKVEFT